MVTKPKATVANAEEIIKKAPKGGQGLTRDVKQLEADLVEVRAFLAGVQSDLNGGNYFDAIENAKGAIAKASDVEEVIRRAIEFPYKITGSDVVLTDTGRGDGSYYWAGRMQVIDGRDAWYAPGSRITIGKGGLTLRGKFYPERAVIYVNEKGEFIVVFSPRTR